MDVLQNPKYSYLLGRQPFFYRVFKVLFYLYSKLVFSTYAPLSVLGRENIPNSSFIFCSNHNSHMDVALLAVSAKKSFNEFGMLAARDYWFENWIKRVAINTVMNLIPVDRGSSKNKKLSIKESEALCNAFMEYGQRNLILFPEGTRGNPGDLLSFKKGAARFALNLNKPILPAVIYGSHKIWPRGKIFFGLPTRINVYILEPIYPKSFLNGANPTEKEVDIAIKKMTSVLEKNIKEKVKTVYEQ
jgi:1-acyl-sn-glycerol-3-phosphate acyltransferase